MKKLFAAILVLALAISAFAFAMAEEKSEGVMTFAEYAAAEKDDEVVIEAYVQDHQGWWEKDGVGYVTIYAQDQDGAYFLYNAIMTQEEAEKLVPGAKIKATGYKDVWSGEVEIVEAKVEFEEGEYIAEPLDVTELLGSDELVEKQNMKVCFKGMTIEDKGDGAAFLYNWDGSGEEGSDLYFDASVNGQTYTFTVESYLRGPGTDVYEAVKALNVGDVVDLEGFLYWYEGANPHITAVSAAE